jgi:hypothetical protein
VVVVLEGQGVDVRVNSQGLAHRDASRAFCYDGATVRGSLPVVVRAAQKVVRVVVAPVGRDVLHDFLIVEIVVVVVREFV